MLRRDVVYDALSKLQKEAKTRLASTVDRMFNEKVMTGLLVTLILTVTFQLFHPDLSSGMKVIFDVVNYIVIAAFAAEYFLKLIIAKSGSRISFITQPVHILDSL